MRAVYTLEELSTLPQNAEGKPARLAVIGNPVAHSLSPQMHQAALDAAGRKLCYIRVQASEADEGFERVVLRLRELGFIGVNVTVPFKKRAFALASSADTLSRLCGASNTLAFTPSGCEASNTDGPGFERAVAELCGSPLRGLSIIILGACGGAGSALAAQCALSGCPQLTLANRPRPELAALAAQLTPFATAHAGCVRTVSMADGAALAATVAEADLIVNATSLGLREGDPLPLDPAWLHEGQAVCDIVPHDTPLRRAAAARGCRASDGLGMLFWQGAYAYKLWFGCEPQATPMREALMAAATH